MLWLLFGVIGVYEATKYLPCLSGWELSFEVVAEGVPIRSRESLGMLFYLCSEDEKGRNKEVPHCMNKRIPFTEGYLRKQNLVVRSCNGDLSLMIIKSLFLLQKLCGLRNCLVRDWALLRLHIGQRKTGIYSSRSAILVYKKWHCISRLNSARCYSHLSYGESAN